MFVNSIKAARRVDGLLRALGLPCRLLHAQQQQKQRLKSLEAFRTAPSSILVATDVAARGLDIPSVQVMSVRQSVSWFAVERPLISLPLHSSRVQAVLHYDIARSPQLYQHRSGRTARAGRAGTTLSLVSPPDAEHHRDVCVAQGLPRLPPLKVPLADLAPLRERVELAKKVWKLFIY